MVNEPDIQLALDELKSQDPPNYRATAKKYKIGHTTLMRRHKGQTMSNQQAHSVYKKLLDDSQEEVLLQHINNLTDRGMPPTPKILANLVREMVKQPIGECWVRRFCKRYSSRLKSLYLRAIDQTRHVADNSAYFEHFYANVRLRSHLPCSITYHLKVGRKGGEIPYKATEYLQF